MMPAPEYVQAERERVTDFVKDYLEAYVQGKDLVPYARGPLARMLEIEQLSLGPAIRSDRRGTVERIQVDQLTDDRASVSYLVRRSFVFHVPGSDPVQIRQERRGPLLVGKIEDAWFVVDVMQGNGRTVTSDVRDACFGVTTTRGVTAEVRAFELPRPMRVFLAVKNDSGETLTLGRARLTLPRRNAFEGAVNRMTQQSQGLEVPPHAFVNTFAAFDSAAPSAEPKNLRLTLYAERGDRNFKLTIRVRLGRSS